MSVQLQAQPLQPGALLDALHAGQPACGALASFVGYVRDFSDGQPVEELFLEHYPGMAEQALTAIEAQARQRWPLLDVQIVHRVGSLGPAEPIVFVGTLSSHRQAALEACAFIIDQLKSRVPLWKRERSGAQARWVAARDSDREAARRWDD